MSKKNYHSHRYEGGGASALLGVSFHTVPNRADGTMDLARIRAAIRPNDPHYPRTAAVCLENTLGGRVLPVEYIDAVGALCKQHGLRCAHRMLNTELLSLYGRMCFEQPCLPGFYMRAFEISCLHGH